MFIYILVGITQLITTNFQLHCKNKITKFICISKVKFNAFLLFTNFPHDVSVSCILGYFLRNLSREIQDLY